MTKISQQDQYTDSIFTVTRPGSRTRILVYLVNTVLRLIWFIRLVIFPGKFQWLQGVRSPPNELNSQVNTGAYNWYIPVTWKIQLPPLMGYQFINRLTLSLDLRLTYQLAAGWTGAMWKWMPHSRSWYHSAQLWHKLIALYL